MCSRWSSEHGYFAADAGIVAAAMTFFSNAASSWTSTRRKMQFREVWFANYPSGFISCRNMFIAMMETAEFCDCYDHAVSHNLSLNRSLLFERKMRTRSVIVAKYAANVLFR